MSKASSSAAADSSSPPSRPQSLAPRDLGFARKAMVSWSNPLQLIQTGMKTLISTLFGSYADKRELLSVLGKDPEYDHREERDANGDFWFDFVADCGDGFHSTYTVAGLLAAPELRVSDPEGTLHRCPRGRVLIFGGDEVYPTASRDEYENRLLGPYRAALPWVETDPPTMYAVPGNHDWYDGLTAFLRIFGQGRWVGGWKTRQSRSYFALRLPSGWWLWAVDIQLGSDMDYPQIQYFERLARERMNAGDRVILCTAEPSWSIQWEGRQDAFRTLAFFEEQVIRANGLDLAMVVAGDLHNYHRYEREDASLQRITAGGGGAFLHGTHFLPRENAVLSEGAARGSDEVPYRFGKAFPGHEESRDITRGARWSFFRAQVNPGESIFSLSAFFQSWGFAAILALYYLGFAWALQSAASISGMTLVQALYRILDNGSVGGAVWNGIKMFWYLATASPIVSVYALFLPAALIGYSGAQGMKRVLYGAMHGLAHLAGFMALFIGFTALNHALGVPVDLRVSLPLEPGVVAVHPAFVALFTLQMTVAGFFLGGLIFGHYLIWRQDEHQEEVFSFQGIEGWKNFLRLRIDAAGRLWVYPMGIRNVCRRWKPNPQGRPGEPWILPETGSLAERVELIEPPLCYDPAKGRWEITQSAEGKQS
jgi:hypothetical protein